MMPTTTIVSKITNVFDDSIDFTQRERTKNRETQESEWNDSRSPSPVIVWRPTARVKLATDIPPALKLRTFSY